MATFAPTPLWVLVTDGHRTRVVVPDAAEGQFRTALRLGVMEHPYGPPPRPGRPHHGPHDQFAEDVAQRLNEAAAEGLFDRLILAAPRALAEEIRVLLAPAVQARTMLLDHDYAALDDAALSLRLARWWQPDDPPEDADPRTGLAA